MYCCAPEISIHFVAPHNLRSWIHYFWWSQVLLLSFKKVPFCPIKLDFIMCRSFISRPIHSYGTNSFGHIGHRIHKAGSSSGWFSNIWRSTKCWHGFFGWMLDGAFTTPTQISLVVSVAAKLYDVVCSVDGYLLTYSVLVRMSLPFTDGVEYCLLVVSVSKRKPAASSWLMIQTSTPSLS